MPHRYLPRPLYKTIKTPSASRGTPAQPPPFTDGDGPQGMFPSALAVAPKPARIQLWMATGRTVSCSEPWLRAETISCSEPWFRIETVSSSEPLASNRTHFGFGTVVSSRKPFAFGTSATNRNRFAFGTLGFEPNRFVFGTVVSRRNHFEFGTRFRTDIKWCPLTPPCPARCGERTLFVCPIPLGSSFRWSRELRGRQGWVE